MEDSTTEATRVSFEKKIDSFAEGDLEHATEVLSALWEIVNGDEEVTAPSGILFSVSLLGFSIPLGVIRACLVLHVIRLHRSRAPPAGPL